MSINATKFNKYVNQCYIYEPMLHLSISTMFVNTSVNQCPVCQPVYQLTMHMSTTVSTNVTCQQLCHPPAHISAIMLITAVYINNAIHQCHICCYITNSIFVNTQTQNNKENQHNTTNKSQTIQPMKSTQYNTKNHTSLAFRNTRRHGLF